MSMLGVPAVEVPWPSWNEELMRVIPSYVRGRLLSQMGRTMMRGLLLSLALFAATAALVRENGGGESTVLVPANQGWAR